MAGKRVAGRKSAGGESPTEGLGTQAATPVVVMLPADCRMAAQAALKADLLGALDAHAIVLDGHAVERIDTATLQLLLVFQRELDLRGSQLSWLGTSDALDEAASLLGLAQMLNLPAAAPV